MFRIKPQPRPVPKIGLVINSIEAFSPEAKDNAERATREFFDSLLKSKEIDPASIIIGRLFGPHEAMEAADQLAAACVDLILIVNIAFPNGQVFLTIATHPHLARTPIAVVADPEPSQEEWASNAWCGVIMNNHVAKMIDRPIASVPGPVGSKSFGTEISRLIRVAGTIKHLRRDFIGRIGDAPGGFHSASGDQLAFAKVFGTRMDTVDLSAVIETYKSGRAKGYLGEQTFTEDEVKAIANELKEGRKVEVGDDMLCNSARLYLTYRAIVRANGYTAAAFRCWPEQLEPYIGVATCLPAGLLVGQAELTAAACEGDWPMSVAQTMGSILSGVAAYFLDFVNYTGGSEIIQLGHCGIGVCGAMADKPGKCGGPCDTIAVHPVIRQAGGNIGATVIGQFAYGPKTGICLMQKRDGQFAILSFQGENTPDTAKGLKYSGADLLVPSYKEVNRVVLEYGFPHHLAVAVGYLNEDLGLMCKFLGVEHIGL
ncbi:MAG: hypothetical protein ACHQ50_08060 [Fimbriimonadales bacterium]